MTQDQGRRVRNEAVNAELVAQYYDDWTSRYQDTFGDTFQACRPAETADLHRYILERSGVRQGERILDAGCGVCGPSIYFASHREITIDAVTVSKAQVAAAQQAVAEAGLSGRVRVHLADFHELEQFFPEATFDRVLFLESLSHAADPMEPLQSAFTVLKPGGIVYIKDFFEKDYECAETQQTARDIVARVDRAFMLKTPHVQHTIGTLERIGFLQEHVGPVGFENDIGVWAKFNEAHSFDLYAGREPLEWCEWIELRFRKPLQVETPQP